MEIKKIEKNVIIKMKINFTEKDYKIVKQENIITSDDNLITGIYKTKFFENKTIFVIACNRNKNALYDTLDYTKIAVNEKDAEWLYKKMIVEIKQDLARSPK